MKILSSDVKVFVITFLAAVLLIVPGIFFFIFCASITDAIYDYLLVLPPGGNFLYNQWVQPQAAVRVHIYFFNWSNPVDFKNTSVKPMFQEIGPYIYKQQYHKANVVYNENFTVTYQVNKTFFFDNENSNGTMDDYVTSLNMVPLIAVDKSRKWNILLKKGLSMAVRSTPYEMKHTVNELLLDGYEDQLLTTSRYLPFFGDIPNMDKFGWFYNRNGSIDYEGTFTVGTGLGNTTLGKLYKWNHKERGPYPGKCGNIQSFLGELLPQRITKEKLSIFLSDFCRRIDFEYTETTTFKGIEVYKFNANTSFLDTGTINPDNTCFCSKKCRKFGVLDYSNCKYGIPAYLSKPHFLGADSFYRNAIGGMAPDKTKHQFYILVNPRTGFVLHVSTAVQLNILVEPSDDITRYRDVPEILMPIFWFKVESSHPWTVLLPIQMLVWLPNIFRMISAVLVVCGLILLSLKVRQRSENPKLIYEKHRNEKELEPLDNNNMYQCIQP